MADETLILTYRELAERLGISPDGARMRVKRAVKSGSWKIITGNHPSDPVRVELPVSDVQGVGGERSDRSSGERKGRTKPRTEDMGIAAALQTAHEHIKALTSQLTEAKDQHREAAIEAAHSTARVEAMAAELARLASTVEALEAELAAERRTWWQRLTGRRNPS